MEKNSKNNITEYNPDDCITVLMRYFRPTSEVSAASTPPPKSATAAVPEPSASTSAGCYSKNKPQSKDNSMTPAQQTESLIIFASKIHIQKK
jgi:hypothetical protein